MSKALYHIVNKFKRSLFNDDNTRRKTNKPLHVTEYDINCLNEVVEYVNNTQKDIMDSNTIFGKLFVHMFAKEIWRTSSYEMALESMRRILDTPLHNKIKEFQIDMMLFNFDQAYEMLGGPKDLDYKKGITPEQRKEQSKEKVKFFKNNEIEMKKALISDHWNQENTENRLIELISDLIYEYQNK